MGKTGLMRGGKATPDNEDEGPSATLVTYATCVAELARLRHLAPQAFDSVYKAHVDRRAAAAADVARLEAERTTLTTRLTDDIQRAAAGEQALDTADRERVHTRLRAIAADLDVATAIIARVDQEVPQHLQRARREQVRAWERLQSLAVLDLYDALQLAATANQVVTEIQQAAAQALAPTGLAPLAWPEFQTAGGRLENWQRFVRQEAPHIELRSTRRG
jgi:leucyl aminopeptidase (aminopeptidase T)